MCWNINGLGDKLGYPEIQTIMCAHDIVVYLETMKDSNFDLVYPGYQCFHYVGKEKTGKAKRPWAGILVMISNNCAQYVTVTDSSDIMVWLTVHNPRGGNIHLGFFYIPQEGSSHSDPSIDYFQSMQDHVMKYSKTGEVLLCGDFNARTGSLCDYVPNCNIEDYISSISHLPDETKRHNVDVTVNTHGKKLIRFCKATALQIQNGRLASSKYTCYRHNGESVVDYLITSSTLTRSVTTFKVGDQDPHSDHCPLTFELEYSKCNRTADSQCDSMSLPHRFIWDKSSKWTYINLLSDNLATEMRNAFICDIIDDDKDINDVVDSFNKCITYAASNSLKLYKSRCGTFPRNPWYDDECKAAKAALHKLVWDKPDADIRAKYGECKKSYKSLIQRKKREYQKDLCEKVDRMQNEDPQAYWNFWKRQKRTLQNHGCIDIDMFTNFYIKQNHCEHFEHFESPHMDKIIEFIDSYDGIYGIDTDGPLNDILNAPINKDEVIHSLKNVKCNKAAGSDGMPAELYKYSGGQIYDTLVALFNKIFDNGRYPLQWCEGIINPLYKKLSRGDPDNYRKITVIPALGKIFEAVLNNRAKFASESLELEDPLQNGFKGGARATDNAFILNSLIDITAARKRPLYVCYVDFKSAFDCVHRKALLYKLFGKGVGGKYFDILKSMYENAKSRVKWNSALGKIFENLRGVLQGGVLSPTLFKIFLSDIKDYLDQNKGVTVGDIIICYILFADDLVLVSETHSGLQSLLNGLEKFCLQWQLLVNLTKTNITVFNAKFVTSDVPIKFFFSGNEIEHSDFYNYVGTVFNNTRDRFGNHFHMKHDKAVRACFAAKKLLHDTLGKKCAI